MCGIVGYIGKGEVKSQLLEGLAELEYRGYDSAGIAMMQEREVTSYKAVGKLKNLEAKCKDYTQTGGVGIGHTRWATHGKPTELNAHPHYGGFSYVVHNGIIENYVQIKSRLQKEGVEFVSQTDTEVIAHLFEYNLAQTKSCDRAFAETVQSLKGAYAILLMSTQCPQEVYFARKGSPLMIGRDGESYFFASSDAAIVGRAKEVSYLDENACGKVSAEGIVTDFTNGGHDLKFVPLLGDKISAQKGGYRFFMEKEVYEQPQVLSDTIMARALDEDIVFEELEGFDLSRVENITLCACGTSFHAALSASYLFEQKSKIKCDVEIASEFRYKAPIIASNTLFIVISQSGETADTLEALKMAKEAGVKTLAICNVDNSSIVRLTDRSILTRAGIEKGVASTKAFATQMMVLWMLSLYLAKQRGVACGLTEELNAIRHIPRVVKNSLAHHEKLRRLSKRYLHGHGFFFIGRDLFYPLAMEGALKLKEISYLHAEGYPAGEMKHGPIALADSELFTVALLPKHRLYDKMKSSVEELSARDATILTVGSELLDSIADDFVLTGNHEHVMAEYYEMMTVLQLLSMEVAIRLGNDVDMPRNLAKSVTVE
ncbi:MAG: glutamine--fructose-6-phosphate transaminase (isomerizing) [Campylobacterota bacterium]